MALRLASGGAGWWWWAGGRLAGVRWRWLRWLRWLRSSVRSGG
ncbi:hypothetical protein AB0K14_39155 [Actinosynnema sp. NPDC050801]